jgi:hypothetical protein
LAKFFCGFCCEYDEVFCEEKKRIENRIEERKKSGWVDRERERERNDQCERFPARDDEWPCPVPRHPTPGPRSQVFLSACPYPSIKHYADDHAVRRMKRVHHRLQWPPSVFINQQQSPLTFTYSSHTSVKNDLIPSSFFPSCSSTNFMSLLISVQ